LAGFTLKIVICFRDGGMFLRKGGYFLPDFTASLPQTATILKGFD